LKKRTVYLFKSAAVASLYVILNFLSSLMGLSNGFIQLRFSEALAIMPIFSIAYVPGLGIGCLIANMLFGNSTLDIIIGTMATVLGAIGTYLLRKRKYLAVLPPIVSNSLLVPIILVISYGNTYPYWLVLIAIIISELISTGILGIGFIKLIENNKQLKEIVS